MPHRLKMPAQLLLPPVPVALSVYWALEELPLSLEKSVAAVESVPLERFEFKKVGWFAIVCIESRELTFHLFCLCCLDIAELDAGNAAKVDFPNPNDLTNFAVTVRPDTGYWAGARYIFNFHIHPEYPHKPPKVLCQTKIYHPNIDLEGNVCLNILKEDWKPVLDINAVIYGLVYLFYEPNPDDPLNREAAELFRNDRNQFQRIVRRTLEGYGHAGVSFERFV